MLSKILTLLAMAQPQEEDEPGRFRQLIIPIIVFSLYILSSLFKGKGGKKPQEPQTPRQNKEQPAKRTRPLPNYARKTQSAQTRQQAPRPSQTRQESPRRVEPPGRSPTSVPGPARPQRTSVPPPAAPRPKPQFKVEQIPAGRPVQRPAWATATAAAQAATPATKAAMAKRTSTKTLVRGQMLSTREGVMLDRKTAAASQEAHTQLTSTEHLQMILRQKDSLVQAIVLAEILGKPVGLRPKGSFELPL